MYMIYFILYYFSDIYFVNRSKTSLSIKWKKPEKTKQIMFRKNFIITILLIIIFIHNFLLSLKVFSSNLNIEIFLNV